MHPHRPLRIRAAVSAALERNAARPSRGAKPSIREQLRQPQGVQRMVDIEAKKAQGKGIGYQRWASTFNLKQAAQALNLYVEHGFSSTRCFTVRPASGETSMTDKTVRLTYQQYRAVRRLVHECCNYDGGNCLALNNGWEPCVCVQSISYGLVCKWFRAAVLPADKGLCAALLYRGRAAALRRVRDDVCAALRPGEIL